MDNFQTYQNIVFLFGDDRKEYILYISFSVGRKGTICITIYYPAKLSISFYCWSQMGEKSSAEKLSTEHYQLRLKKMDSFQTYLNMQF